MKRNLIILYCILMVSGLASCEKDVITNAAMDSKNRTVENTKALKNVLQNAPNGWVMMVKSSLSANAYTPIVMKFDTTKNIVDVKTVYGITDPNPSFFEIDSGTGSLLLTFSTSSIMTSLFRIGATASDVTDHIYKVMKISDDSIEIQGYRSGAVYKPEGGVTYKLFKRPANWDWANAAISLDFSNATWRNGIINRDGTFEFEYMDGTPKLTLKVKLGVWSDASITSYRTRDPFVTNVSAKGFLPMYPIVFDHTLPTSNTYNTTTDRLSPLIGHNAIAYYPFTFNAQTNANTIAFASKIKSQYLVLTGMTRSDATATAAIDLNFVAYDKTGEIYLKAKYSLR
ncbi:DUF4302 domain-containing protein [Pedobacter sp. MC2016-24]|uniref:DUF4302 domain-containing protein n=1 Tax=Pedobacter sp. MC2016-24 TaxID=2780090 RepID=UPI0018804448|nr:DUF4302 domain-containing protein [Pedobacter sp. MC2016-24]MBE9600955.1 DUF4302 domain-containing protein [Pedobacter sp. MC2016-24]